MDSQNIIFKLIIFQQLAGIGFSLLKFSKPLPAYSFNWRSKLPTICQAKGKDKEWSHGNIIAMELVRAKCVRSAEQT